LSAAFAAILGHGDDVQADVEFGDYPSVVWQAQCRGLIHHANPHNGGGILGCGSGYRDHHDSPSASPSKIDANRAADLRSGSRERSFPTAAFTNHL
jgi:hypothetical protein